MSEIVIICISGLYIFIIGVLFYYIIRSHIIAEEVQIYTALSDEALGGA